MEYAEREARAERTGEDRTDRVETDGSRADGGWRSTCRAAATRRLHLPCQRQRRIRAPPLRMLVGTREVVGELLHLT